MAYTCNFKQMCIYSCTMCIPYMQTGMITLRRRSLLMFDQELCSMVKASRNGACTVCIYQHSWSGPQCCQFLVMLASFRTKRMDLEWMCSVVCTTFHPRNSSFCQLHTKTAYNCNCELKHMRVPFLNGDVIAMAQTAFIGVGESDYHMKGHCDSGLNPGV